MIPPSSPSGAGRFPAVLVAEFTIESTDRDAAESFAAAVRDSVAKLRVQRRFLGTVSVSESLEDISYDN